MTANVTNLHKVTDWLFRGGQPNEAGLQQLYDSGIRTVISFRWHQQVTDWDRDACERIGLKFYAIPLTYTVVTKIADASHSRIFASTFNRKR